MRKESKIDEIFANNRIPIRYKDGQKVITCEKCGETIPYVATTDNFYSSHDLYICPKCNIGYKARLFTGLGADQYISIEQTLLSDIQIIVDSKTRMEKFRQQTREAIAKSTVKRGRPRKDDRK